MCNLGIPVYITYFALLALCLHKAMQEIWPGGLSSSEISAGNFLCLQDLARPASRGRDNKTTEQNFQKRKKIIIFSIVIVRYQRNLHSYVDSILIHPSLGVRWGVYVKIGNPP